MDIQGADQALALVQERNQQFVEFVQAEQRGHAPLTEEIAAAVEGFADAFLIARDSLTALARANPKLARFETELDTQIGLALSETQAGDSYDELARQVTSRTLTPDQSSTKQLPGRPELKATELHALIRTRMANCALCIKPAMAVSGRHWCTSTTVVFGSGPID